MKKVQSRSPKNKNEPIQYLNKDLSENMFFKYNSNFSLPSIFIYTIFRIVDDDFGKKTEEEQKSTGPSNSKKAKENLVKHQTMSQIIANIWSMRLQK